MTEPTKTPNVGNQSVPEWAEFMRQFREDSTKAYAEDLQRMFRLGVITRDTDQGDAYLLQRDFWGTIPSNRHDDVDKYLAGLSATEKLALRHRVLGVAEFPGHNSE